MCGGKGEINGEINGIPADGLYPLVFLESETISRKKGKETRRWLEDNKDF